MGIFGDRRDDWPDTVDLLRRTEEDAARACALAAEAIRDEPLTRGQLLSFRSEHEQHRAALAALPSHGEPRRREPTDIIADRGSFAGRMGSTAVLRLIRANAELAVRRYRLALREAPLTASETIRSQCNAWLRHRAWLTARIDAFARDQGFRSSSASRTT